MKRNFWQCLFGLAIAGTLGAINGDDAPSAPDAPATPPAPGKLTKDQLAEKLAAAQAEIAALKAQVAAAGEGGNKLPEAIRARMELGLTEAQARVVEEQQRHIDRHYATKAETKRQREVEAALRKDAADKAHAEALKEARKTA